MEHARCSEYHHRSRVVNVGPVKWLKEGGRKEADRLIQTKLWLSYYLDVLKLKHVSLNKCISDILVGP